MNEIDPIVKDIDECGAIRIFRDGGNFWLRIIQSIRIRERLSGGTRMPAEQGCAIALLIFQFAQIFVGFPVIAGR